MMIQPTKRKSWPLVFLLLSSTAILGWLRLQAAQDDAAAFAKRDAWQRPEEVMDKLGIKPGSVVADVGCGSGYFTFHLASRVGEAGKVYAEDIESEVLEKLQSRVTKEHLKQVEIVQGTPDDPFLPDGKVDVILIVNAYHEMKNYDAMLSGMYRALKPDGLLGIIDHEATGGQARSEYQDQHRIPEQLVREDTARNGFHFLRSERGFESSDSGKKYFFLVFEKPKPAERSN
jgi:ubiquinone/menaquinone biosynthesis C-methylase UbiE